MTCAVYTYPLLDLPQLNWLNSVFSSSLSPTSTSSAPRGSYWNAIAVSGVCWDAEILGICLELYLHTLAHHLRLLSSSVNVQCLSCRPICIDFQCYSRVRNHCSHYLPTNGQAAIQSAVPPNQPASRTYRTSDWTFEERGQQPESQRGHAGEDSRLDCCISRLIYFPGCVSSHGLFSILFANIICQEAGTWRTQTGQRTAGEFERNKNLPQLIDKIFTLSRRTRRPCSYSLHYVEGSTSWISIYI